jgi:hypothetical protein
MKPYAWMALCLISLPVFADAAADVDYRAIRDRLDAYRECEGIGLITQRPPRREGEFVVIELLKPLWWANSKIYIHIDTGAVRWEHAKRPECGKPTNPKTVPA